MSTKKLFLLSALSLLGLSQLRAQTILKGRLVDSSSNTTLTNASITVLNAKDSFLYSFIRSNAAGAFSMALPDTGRYVLLVEYPDYGNYVEIFHTGKKSIDLGNINLRSKVQILKDVIVKSGGAPIRIKGDTTEFTADSFKVQANASVEDLLKKLPGIQVDKDGKITAQGQSVKKVLVDGEEFFGDDPTLVTKNLRADMIDKVQVYDKKSDQATFTGIDDGVKDKTINLKIKEDQKKGAFGKISAGVGNKGFHESQAMFNKFKNKEKIGFFGIIANTGKAGLGWQDNQSYGSGNNSNADDNGVTIDIGNSSNDDIGWNGNFSGQGIPLIQTGGLHYDNKWDADKYAINGNYKIANLSVAGNSQTISQNNLPGNIQYSNSSQDFKNKSLRNKLNGTFEVQLDSSSSLKVYAEGSLNHKDVFSDYTASTQRENNSLLNNSERKIANTGNNNDFNSTILWRKKFRKKGRTLSFNLDEKYNANDMDGTLYSSNNFYNTTGALDSTSLIDQRKSDNGNTLTFDTKLTYTEPLSKVSSLIANYGIVTSNSQSDRLSYNPSTPNVYDVLDSTFSNRFTFDQFMHRTGLSYNYSKGKTIFNFGSNVGFNKFDLKNQFTHTTLHRNFVNWYPQATFKYSFTSQKRLTVSYNGTASQPSIAQIQPFRSNTDPLNVYVGNENLKPSFQNKVEINYFTYQMLSNTYFGMYSFYNQTERDITTNTQTDFTTGKNTYQYVNVNGNYMATVVAFYGKKITKWDAQLNASLSGTLNNNINFVNDEKNTGKNNSYGLQLGMNKSKENKYDIGLNGSVNYNVYKSSLQTASNNNYWSYTLTPNADLLLPARFQLHTDLNYSFQQKTSTFGENISIPIWNAWLGKKFFKNDALLIKFGGNDLLNKNTGFSRYQNNNIITQNMYSTIRRYFMLTAVWNFKSGMGVTPTERSNHF